MGASSLDDGDDLGAQFRRPGRGCRRGSGHERARGRCARSRSGWRSTRASSSAAFERCCCASETSGGSSWSCIVPSAVRSRRGCGCPGPRTSRASARSASGTALLTDPCSASKTLAFQYADARAVGDCKRLGLDDGLAAHPDGVTGVTAQEVGRRQRHRQLDGLVGAVEVGAVELLATTRSPTSIGGAEVTGLTQAAAQRDRALDRAAARRRGRRPSGSSSRMASSMEPRFSRARAIR